MSVLLSLLFRFAALILILPELLQDKVLIKLSRLFHKVHSTIIWLESLHALNTVHWLLLVLSVRCVSNSSFRCSDFFFLILTLLSTGSDLRIDNIATVGGVRVFLPLI